MQAFDNEKYLKCQKRAFLNKIDNCTKLYIEVGGKLIQDKHASRVLPGYDENQKLNFIKELFNNDFELVYSISADNIINQKIREDFSTDYTEETFRLFNELQKVGIVINNVIISKYRKNIRSDILDNFISKLKNMNKNVHYLYYMNHYTPCKEFLKEFDNQPFINLSKKNIVVTGPGGGSGKFAFCLSQLYNEMKNGNKPQYIKYESFPVHNLDITHPLNLAYMSATADLEDIILEDKYQSGSISYNRDLQNFELLKFIANQFDNESYFLKSLTSPTDMGINFIKEGIINDDVVKEASSIEIFRRFLIHKKNYHNGTDDKDYTKNIRKILHFIIDSSNAFL